MATKKNNKKSSKKTTPKKAKRTAAKRMTMTKAQRDQLAIMPPEMLKPAAKAEGFEEISNHIIAALDGLKQIEASLSKTTAQIGEDDVVDNTWDEKLAKAQDYYDGTQCAEEMEELGLARIGYQCIAFKYMYRAGRKQGESTEVDLASAEWYLTRALEKYPELEDDQRFVKLAEMLEQLQGGAAADAGG